VTEETLRQKIVKVARSWVGTPFFPHTAKKGVGADCVHFALEVYKEAGAVPQDTSLPEGYSLGGGDHLERSLVVSWLSSCKWVAPEDGWPQPGSVVTFQFGRVAHHVAIVTDGNLFVHAVRDYGVIELNLKDPTWTKRLRSSWKPRV
jgi:cell wall-associated NlpC family hydrolase